MGRASVQALDRAGVLYQSRVWLLAAANEARPEMAPKLNVVSILKIAKLSKEAYFHIKMSMMCTYKGFSCSRELARSQDPIDGSWFVRKCSM